MKIEKSALIAAINAPFLPRDPAIRMYPFAITMRATAAGGTFSTVIIQPTPSIATVIRRLVITSSTGTTILHYVRLLSGTDATAILAGGAWTAEGAGESPRGPLLLQTLNRQDQTGKSLIQSGRTTVASSREGAIWRHGDGLFPGGAVAYPEAPRIELQLDWPAILWGDDSDKGGPPALAVQPSAANFAVRVSAYGEEWPLDTDPSLYK